MRCMVNERNKKEHRAISQEGNRIHIDSSTEYSLIRGSARPHELVVMSLDLSLLVGGPAWDSCCVLVVVSAARDF